MITVRPVDRETRYHVPDHTDSGTEALKQHYLPGLCSGALIGASAATKPEAGSDVFAMRTRATRDGDVYVLNGSKTFVSNAPVAGLLVVYATPDPELGPMENYLGGSPVIRGWVRRRTSAP
jgi:alkylation response protein AidB-like acyl-CoA dehydrogenase